MGPQPELGARHREALNAQHAEQRDWQGVRVDSEPGQAVQGRALLPKQHLHNEQRQIFLILDGGSFHHSRPVRDYVESLGGKLQLFFLPPYSPELNPDEQVWNYVKHHGVAKAALHSRDDLKKFVLARLHSLQRLPWTIRMFFLTPDTQYAVL